MNQKLAGIRVLRTESSRRNRAAKGPDVNGWLSIDTRLWAVVLSTKRDFGAAESLRVYILPLQKEYCLGDGVAWCYIE